MKITKHTYRVDKTSGYCYGNSGFKFRPADLLWGQSFREDTHALHANATTAPEVRPQPLHAICISHYHPVFRRHTVLSTDSVVQWAETKWQKVNDREGKGCVTRTFLQGAQIFILIYECLDRALETNRSTDCWYLQLVRLGGTQVVAKHSTRVSVHAETYRANHKLVCEEYVRVCTFFWDTLCDHCSGNISVGSCL